MIQDGAVDELMSVALLLTMRDVDLRGIVVVNADCLAEPTVEVTRKILALMGRLDVPVGTSAARAVNAFPWVYRQYSMMVNLLPMLNVDGSPEGPVEQRTGEQIIIDAVKEAQASDERITLLILSPLTPLSAAIEQDPSICPGIESVLWMGGAVGIAGNVDPGLSPGANAAAEWNAYWDPVAVENVFASGLQIEMFPLNATNGVMLSADQVLSFAPGSPRYPLYALAGQMYAMVAFEAGYAFWDTVTTAYLADPSLFTLEQQRLGIVTTGPKQGTISVDDAGDAVHVAQPMTKENLARFYEYLKHQWKIPAEQLGS